MYDEVSSEKQIVAEHARINPVQGDLSLFLGPLLHMPRVEAEEPQERETKAPTVGTEVGEGLVHCKPRFVEIVFQLVIADRIDMDVRPPFFLIPLDGRKVIEHKTPVQKKLEPAAQVQNIWRRHDDRASGTKDSSDLATQGKGILHVFDHLGADHVVEGLILKRQPLRDIALTVGDVFQRPVALGNTVAGRHPVPQ